MRFARLTLERYGRFEDCSLVFRPGAPDLHVIYGPNEAGKSTTLAAVSDLLFGFGARATHDFRFDKSLLRIGAEIEEDERTLVCRRRRGNTGTLINANDAPIDEAMLLGMLRGQTRDGFRLAFSLDQERLRLGGRAMVEAKDDIGQALFAAGSGLTEVASELDRLNEEADAIWGRRGSKRLFAVAERDHLDAQRQMRDAALKPKAWTDARAAAERSKSAQTALEDSRDLLAAEQRKVERIRRIAPGLRRREALLASMEVHGNAISLTPQREALSDAAMAAAEAAERQRAAAEALHTEAQTRLVALVDDGAVLDAADRIDDLAERRGAFTKATQDRARLVAERRVKQVRIEELQRELGGATIAIPSRIAVSRLRDLARRHTEAASGVQTMSVTVADLSAREKPLRDRLADATLSEGLPALVAAVDAAYRLGADVDARCEASARDVVRSRATAEAALKRLTPWIGTANLLEVIGTVSDDEITCIQRDLTDLRSKIDQEGATAARLGEEAAALALERAKLAHDGQGVPADALTSARSVREHSWSEISEHLRGGERLPDPSAAADTYARAVAQADAVADLRFASAQASGRLADLDTRCASLELQATQARRRGEDLAAAFAAAVGRWNARTAAASLPELEPIQLRSWLVDRQSALEADRAAADADVRSRTDCELRSTAIGRLLDAMPGVVAAEPLLLAPVLAIAETRRREGEARDAAFREDRAELREIERSLDEQRRRLTHAADEVSRVAADWDIALVEAGLELAISTAEARLAIFEELRAGVDAAAQLDHRLSGIDAESARFEADVGELARDIGEEFTADATVTLTTIRRRLETGRDLRRQLAGLAAEIERRQVEIDAATAARTAAIASAAPVRAELGLAPDGDLAAAVEKSRSMRALRDELAMVERELGGLGDGYPLLDLVDEWRSSDPDEIARRAAALSGDMADMNAKVSEAATASGEASRAFSAIEGASGAAAGAASDAEQARAEMAVQAEAYMLKRTQALTLRWAMDQYRERRQDPLLVRASELFAALTMGRYLQLRVDLDGAKPRLGGLCEDGRTIVEVASMSEGTTDQLFLALRLAAMEQSVAAGVRLPFLADDLFVNFDDERAEAGFRVLAELAQSTQVLFFTHHPHLAAIAARVVGVELHSECTFA